MSDAITPTGSQGPSPPTVAMAAAQAASAAGTAKTSGAATTVASAEAKAIQAAADQAQEAAQLDLSPASQLQKQTGKPQVMTMEEAAQAFQDYLKSLPSNLQFQPDWQAGIVVFKVVNPVTQKVIRQLPPDEVVNQVRAMRLAERQSHSGILLDEST